MIVVRETFKINPEGMKEVRAVLMEGKDLFKAMGTPTGRAMTDLVGEYYTLVMEMDFPNLGEFEASLRKVSATDEWQKWYSKIRRHVRGGRREIFTLIE